MTLVLKQHFLQIVAIGVLSLAPIAYTSTTQFTDPFKYCKAVGTIDKPDSRYVGKKVPQSIVKGLGISGDMPQEGVFWRCMKNKVFACYVGANIPCETKADTSRTPKKELIDWCKENPSADIPAVVTGRETVYSWKCRNSEPEIKRQISDVDDAGFNASYWKEIQPGSKRD